MENQFNQKLRIEVAKFQKPYSIINRLERFHEMLSYEPEMGRLEDWSTFAEGHGVEHFAGFYCPNCSAEVYAKWEDYPWIRNIISSSIKLLDRQYRGTLDEIRNDYGKHGQLITKQLDEIYQSGCPICGGQYSEILYRGSEYNIPDSYASYSDPPLDRIFSYIRGEYSEKKSASVFSEFIELLEKEHKINSTKTARSTQKSLTKAQLKEYLLSLIQLETDILSSTDYLEELLNYHYSYENDSCSADVDAIVKLYHSYNRKELECQDALSCLRKKENDVHQWQKCLQQHNKTPIGNAPPSTYVRPEPREPIPPEYKKPGLFNKKKIEEQNKQLQEEYNAAVEAFQLDLENHHKYIADLKIKATEHHATTTKALTTKVAVAQQEETQVKQKIEQIEQEMTQIKQEIIIARNKAKASAPTSPTSDPNATFGGKVDAAKDLLKKLYRARSEMYGLNIIFGKYRNLVALSMFYEYLISGRCNGLEGAHGAYNLYETEIRADLIISKLSDVVDCLEDIAETQHTVYTQLINMNETMDQLRTSMETVCDSIETIEKNSAVTAFNTQAAAYYAKVNANLTNALGFMIALK